MLVVLIIFISLTYHFLQRPLELIFWNKYYHEKEYQNAKDVSKLLWNNEEEFKKVFKEQNLNQELKTNQKELLNYMHYFKKDFKFMQILGLDNAYLVALKNKDALFTLQMQNNLNYFYFISNNTDLEEINNYLNVVDELLVFMNEIEKLPPKYNLGKIIFEFTFVNYNTLFFGFTLNKNFICSIPQKEQLLENMINSYERMNLLYDINLKTEIQEMIYSAIYGAKRYNHFIDITKGKLNACGK